jgi:serine/threonine-protein kinase
VNQHGRSIADAVEEFLVALPETRRKDIDTLAEAIASDDRKTIRQILPADVAAELDALTPKLENATRNARGGAELGGELSPQGAAIVLGWVEASASASDVVLAPLLDAATASHADAAQAMRAARQRAIRGPFVDAVRCLPMTGDFDWLAEDPAASARVDLLLWEAAARAHIGPELGQWLWADEQAFETLVLWRSRGTLRERALAARTLQVAAAGIPGRLPVRIEAATLSAARRMFAHPDPDVWVPAALALGRLSEHIASLRLELGRWLDSDTAWERRRVMTSIAAIPDNRGELYASHVERLLESDDEWQLAAVGPAVPYISRERRDLWEPLAAHLVDKTRAPHVMWSLVQGVMAQARGGRPDSIGDRILREARARSITSNTKSISDAMLWRIIHRDTDFLDGLEVDRAFPDAVSRRIARDSIRLGAARTHERAARVALTIEETFERSLARAGTATEAAELAYALASVESCAKASALAMWQPVMMAAGVDGRSAAEAIAKARATMGEHLSTHLELDELNYVVRRTALRALANSIDATPRPGDVANSQRGRASAFALSSLTRSKWAQGANRRQMQRFRKPVADLLWRVADALRSDDDTYDVQLGPLAAWWALLVGGEEFVRLLDKGSAEARADVLSHATTLRDAATAAVAGASVRSWSSSMADAMDHLGAADTVLSHALGIATGAMAGAEQALEARSAEDLPYALEYLAEAIALLTHLRREPLLALESAARGGLSVVADAELVSLATAAIDPDGPPTAEVAATWVADIGPLLGPIVCKFVLRILDTQRIAAAKHEVSNTIGPYERIKLLGGGAQGDVWLVKREGTNRRFVIKQPASTIPREELNKRLEDEAKILEGVYEATLSALCDYGWSEGKPYIVLQYLIGADLHEYSLARPLSYEEMRPVVRDVCLGLRALHEWGYVHRDLKPANVFLRLQLPRSAEEKFTDEHRNPKVARFTQAVLIDLGIASVMATESDVTGTLGYISPEQARGEVLGGRSDVYALAATIYTAMTRRRFFEEYKSAPSHLMAHSLKYPFDNQYVLQATERCPSRLIELLRAATQLDPRDRPDVDSFYDALAR